MTVDPVRGRLVFDGDGVVVCCLGNYYHGYFTLDGVEHKTKNLHLSCLPAAQEAYSALRRLLKKKDKG